MSQQIIGGKFIADYPDIDTGALKPASGYKLHTYVSGTITNQASYSDAELTSPNTNPITLDTRGEASVFLPAGLVYTLVLKNTTGSTIWTRDGIVAPVSPSDLSSTTGAGMIGYSSLVAYPNGTIGKTIKDLVINLESSSGSDGIGFIQAGAGAISRTLQDKSRERISVKDFGAACDGVTPDRIAVQKAIDHCSISGWPTLEVPGVCYIESPLKIDRPVDTTSTEFFIVGTGPNGGFYTDQAINIFSSNLSVTTDPQSEFVVFQKINFSAPINTLAAYAVDGNAFLRMRFDNCYFQKIRCAKTTNYLQSFYFNACNIRNLRGYLLESVTGGLSALSGAMFDINWTDNIFEKSSLGVAPTGFLRAMLRTVGCSFNGGVFESTYGPFYDSAETNAAAFSGIYFEENTDQEIKLGSGRGASIFGCFFEQTTDRFNINCGTCYAVTGGGNRTNRRLYFDTNMTYANDASGLQSFGDYADVQLMASQTSIGGVTGSFTATLTGFAAPINVTVNYVRMGRLITLSWPETSGASNVGTMFLTSIPSTLLPVGRTMQASAPVIDNGVYLGLTAATVDSGGVTFCKTWQGTVGPAFTAAGTKGIAAYTMTYQR